jgi:hypothetical protein
VVERKLSQSGTTDVLRVIIGGLLVFIWSSIFYILYFEGVPPLHILFGFMLVSAAIGVLSTYWRRRRITRKESETWYQSQGRWVALFIAGFYLVLSFLVLMLSETDRTLSNLAFVSVTGASFGFFILSRRISPYTGSTPLQAVLIHGFVMLASAAFTVIGIVFVLSHDQLTWLGFYALMAFSAALSYYLGEPMVQQPS